MEERYKNLDHEVRAKEFISQGLAMMKKKHPDTDCSLYDETDAMLQVNDALESEAMGERDYLDAVFFADYAEVVDKYGARHTDVRGIINGSTQGERDASILDLTESAQQLGGRLTDLTRANLNQSDQKPFFANIRFVF